MAPEYQHSLVGRLEFLAQRFPKKCGDCVRPREIWPHAYVFPNVLDGRLEQMKEARLLTAIGCNKILGAVKWHGKLELLDIVLCCRFEIDARFSGIVLACHIQPDGPTRGRFSASVHELHVGSSLDSP